MQDIVKSMKDLGQLKLTAMVAAALILIAFFIFLSLRISSPMMSPLYSNLTMEDSGRIVQELETKKIPYELRANGSQIMVSAQDALKLRVQLAQQGIPSGGSIVGYEIFDRAESLGTSNFVLNVNMIRALEGELARTITSLDKVEKARVHLVMPKRELFTRERQEPTASVVLKLRGSLGRGETDGIANLISTAVPGLKSTNVTILDHTGRALKSGNLDENDPQVVATKTEEYRTTYEARIVRMIEDLVGQSVGFDKVKAKVTADIDFDRIVRNSETYDPEGQVVRSVQGVTEREQESEGKQNKDVSVKNNLPDGAASNGANSSSRVVERSDETTNYEISKTVENHVKETGTVKRLSVAVLLDGKYLESPNGGQQYVERTPAEIEKIETLVKSAIGFDEDRGDSVVIETMRFNRELIQEAEPGPFDWLQKDLRNIVQTLVLGGVAILAILLIIRPLVNRAIEASAAAESLAEEEKSVLAGPQISAALESQLATSMALTEEDSEEEEDLISIEKTRGKGRSATIRRVTDVLDKHPDEAVEVFRAWYNGL